MSEWTSEYTLEVYKSDKRTKSGERLFQVTDMIATGSPRSAVVLHWAEVYSAPTYRTEVHDTYVTKKNLMNGEEFLERYDTPHYMSLSSLEILYGQETYWA
jgi:hypothetical protein